MKLHSTVDDFPSLVKSKQLLPAKFDFNRELGMRMNHKDYSKGMQDF
jgi:hypothetical protein